jgi:hypothetical protein
MPITQVNLSDNITTFVNKTNIIAGDIGDVDQLVTGDSNLVDALNSVREIVRRFDDSAEIFALAREATGINAPLSIDVSGADGINLSFDQQTGILSLTGSVSNSDIRSLFSAADGLEYNSTTGQISISSAGINVDDLTGSYVTAANTSGNGISGSVNQNAGVFTVTSNATSANTASTIVFRDASGNFSAGIITGTATKARYADVAEIYSTKEKYAEGTVVCISDDDKAEMEAWKDGFPVTGVISTDPAYLMNHDADGQPIALVGRVPVRVVGTVAKGQPVYASENGIASATGNGPVVGYALETNDISDEKTVECYLKF